MKKKGNIYETYDYDIFKRLDGNRDVSDARVAKIQASIRKIGQRMDPIIVKKMEVIDGQARLEAFRREGLPVYYIVEPGTGIDECMVMNVHQKNWVQDDYINAYSERGFLDYRYLKQLCVAYKKYVGVSTIFAALRDVYCDGGSHYGETIPNGNFTCTTEQYEHAVRKLDVLVRFAPYVKQAEGAKRPYWLALLFCISLEDVDVELLYKKVSTAVLKHASTTLDALERLEDIYNYRNRDRAYMAMEFKKRRRV